MSFNRVILMGHLGGDPESRTTQTGTNVVNMRLATNRVRNGDDGQRTEVTDWHRIVVFGKQADACNRYLAKGRQVLVEGRIQTNEWTDKEGNRRFSTEVVANRVQFTQQPK